MEKLGIIAGAGELPVLLARAAVAQGRTPVIIQITRTPSQKLARMASALHSLGVGQIQKITRIFLDAGVREIVMIGRVDKRILFRPFRVDPTAIRILAKTRNSGATAIVAAIIDHFELKGLSVIEQHHFLSDLLPPAGVLTKKKPTSSQWTDIEYGVDLARHIANLDIGQTVVVKDRNPIAIEAVEGTDQTIRRGGKLGGKGIIVAKAASTNHDFRVDVPTIGGETLQVLNEVHGSVLAVEANRTFILNQQTLCQQADKWGISIVAVEPSK